ncbi:MAG: hypothetical protein M0P69_20165 [Bacteroidales bacterium]|jgi:hypothetical protein|nr:hypothetical protein [Bacteroidales bacterium]
MRVKLIDFDSKIPNLALMQISSWHRSQGDITGFDIDNPDEVYISCVFSKNAEQARGIATFYPNATVHLGGSGVNYIHLPEYMQKVRPDYQIYPENKKSIGFTTRGCIRNCGFCIVPQKEGKFCRWHHIRDFHNPEFKSVMCLDNNLLADPEWFFINTDYVLENNLKWNPIQGLDVRLLTSDIAERLKETRLDGCLHFAFDNMKDEADVLHGIRILRDAGIDLKHDVQFYVLVGFNTNDEEDKYRCRLLKTNGTNPFVMQYARTKQTRKLAQWANRKHIFWACDIDEMW